MKSLEAFIKHKAYNLRRWSIIQTSLAGSGHVTSCLSAADIIATLFFYAMRLDPSSHENLNNDRFILSKGHAAPLLYAAWEQLGVITAEELKTYRSINSPLEGHPTFRFPYGDAATGSLGIGLSIGIGRALSARLHRRSYHTYVLMGDSEISEGSVWEAVFLAAYYKLNNLIGLIDCNRLGQSNETMFGTCTTKYQQIFDAAGWQTYVVDGHSISDLMHVFDKAKTETEKPVMIIAQTYKGFGISKVENREGFHGKPFSLQELPTILAELEARFSNVAHDKENNTHNIHNTNINDTKRNDKDKSASAINSNSIQNYSSTTEYPTDSQTIEHTNTHKRESSWAQITAQTKKQATIPTYKEHSPIATRKAFGQAITLLGDVLKNIVCLDAEVKNSTFTELFEQKHPDRFIQCFIAEQNMIGIGIGLSLSQNIPFIATFGAFFTRAHDQIRMAVLNNASLRLIGSHVGVSIGQDGPSQMALEDIALMRALPNSIILYPSDAQATYKLTELMAYYNTGISYMRTTRADTPLLYDTQEQFHIGGCKVVRSTTTDQVCIVAAGITLFEALKAADILANGDTKLNPINISVIDLYSIKPCDFETIIATARNSNNKIITVEDHYIQGGIGEMIASGLCNTEISVSILAVTELPRSGKPEELLAWARIDAQAIVNRVYELCTT